MQRTCLKNVCFPLELTGTPKAKAEARARELLETVGLPDKAGAYPAQLSGGQQQRIAIARALATNPRVLLCDEATSALDPKTTQQILALIREINRKLGITVIIITHQMSVVEAICNKVAILDRGTVVEKGSVRSVFANPRSDAAKRLVNPDREDESFVIPEGSRAMRLSFDDSETTETPLIAKLAIEKGIQANILSASTRSVEGKAFGKMILSIEDKGTDFQDAMVYLNQSGGVRAEEVTE
jgi:D-methionine transport system ATP-binding protein